MSCFLFLAFWLVTGPALSPGDLELAQIRRATTPAPAPGYRLYALRIGVTKDAKRDLFIRDESLPERIEIAFAFWLLQGFGRQILVDAGFIDQKMKSRWRVQSYRDPVGALAELDVTPEKITDVIITHRHWDHLDGVKRFASARLWLSQREHEGVWQWAKKNDHALYALLRAAKAKGRLRVCAPLEEVAPSVVVVPVGLHTPGFQYVVVHNPDGRWVLASDIGPLWANFAGPTASGQSSNQARARAVLGTIFELVRGELGRIVPGHEPRLFLKAQSVELTETSAP